MNGAEKIAIANEAIKNLKDFIELERTSTRMLIDTTKKSVQDVKKASLIKAEESIKKIDR